MSQRLLDALRGMVGLVQLVQERYPDFPVDNHRVIEAMSAIKEAEAPVPEELTKEVEQLRVQLAGCSVAALGWNGPESLAKRGDYGWSVPYQDVLELRAKYERLQADFLTRSPQLLSTDKP